MDHVNLIQLHFPEMHVCRAKLRDNTKVVQATENLIPFFDFQNLDPDVLTYPSNFPKLLQTSRLIGTAVDPNL